MIGTKTSIPATAPPPPNTVMHAERRDRQTEANSAFQLLLKCAEKNVWVGEMEYQEAGGSPGEKEEADPRGGGWGGGQEGGLRAGNARSRKGGGN